MVDAPSIPPSSSGSTPVTTPDTPGETASSVTVVRAAPVEKSPPVPPQSTPAQPMTLQGEVVKSDPTTSIVRITTPQGTVEISTAVPLPVGTDVTIDLYVSPQTTLANISVEKQQLAMMRAAVALREAAPVPAAPPPSVPLPTLKVGDTVTALKLDSAPVMAASPAPLPTAGMETVTKIITEMKSLNIPFEKLDLPISAAALQPVFQAPDPLATLRALPASIQQKISDYIAKPEFLISLKNILPAESWNNLNLNTLPALPAASAAVPPAPDDDGIMALFRAFVAQTTSPALAAPDGEISDNNLLPILRAQTTAQITQKIISLPDTPPTTTPATTPATTVPGVATSVPFLTEALATLSASGTLNNSINSLFQSLLSLDQAYAMADKPVVPQNMFQMQIVDIKPPATAGTPATLSPTPTPSSPALLFGDVEAVTPNGFPLIKTDDSSFVLRTPVSIAVGSRITFKLAPITAQQLASAPTSGKTSGADAGRLFEPLRDAKWATLDDALQHLAKIAPDTLQNVQNTLPSPTARLAPTALLFLAALRLGEIKNWLGENTLNTLRAAGKRDLVDRLTRDFGRLSQQTKEPLPGEWRAISMPMLHDEQLSQVQFFIRQQRDDEQEKEDAQKRATRFVLNMNFSRLGAMQMDGYIRRKNLDMVLRTAQALPLDIRQQITQRFNAGLEQVNMQGLISFQTRDQGWVQPGISDKPGVVA